MRPADSGHHRRRVALILALLAAVAVGLLGTAAPRERSTAHFVISYASGFGSHASSEAYINWVAEGLEAAYTAFVKAGFSLDAEPIAVRLVETYAGELGAEYLESDGAGGWHPVIEIATEDAMRDYLAYAYVETTLEDLVLSTCAHELFHVIQEVHSIDGTGDISEQAWIEAHATAVQEFVVPTANDYLEPAIDFLLAPDGIAFLHRTYDAGIFWVFVIERFGMSAILEVMSASAIYDGVHALDAAFAVLGTSFLDVWSRFAVASATGDLPDAEIIASLIPREEAPGWWTATRDPAPLPPVVHQATWTGAPLTLATVNAEQQSEGWPLYEEDPVGSPLRVAHAFGIDVLEILVDEPGALSVTFSGAPDTVFRTFVASETSDGWATAAFVQTTTVALDPTTSRVRLIVTRTEPGCGEYRVTVRPL